MPHNLKTQEEADSRFYHHAANAALSTGQIVIWSLDTDVTILCCYFIQDLLTSLFSKTKQGSYPSMTEQPFLVLTCAKFFQHFTAFLVVAQLVDSLELERRKHSSSWKKPASNQFVNCLIQSTKVQTLMSCNTDCFVENSHGMMHCLLEGTV